MSNPMFFALAALAAAAIVAAAMVTPQGLGARSPPPFGHALAPLKPPAPPSTAHPDLRRGRL